MKKKFIVDSHKHPFAAWVFTDIPDCDDASLKPGDEVIIKQLRIALSEDWDFDWITDFKYHAVHDPDALIDEIIETVSAPNGDICFLFPEIEIEVDLTEEHIDAIDKYGIELQFGYTQEMIDANESLKDFDFFEDSVDYHHQVILEDV
jgi:hypothetical protein